jgi:hypothetical protein
MGAVATSERRAVLASPPAAIGTESRLFEPRTGGASLEDSILRSWGEVVDLGETTCPVCAGRMHAASRCEDCGSELA